MSRSTRSNPLGSVLPEGALPCVWMSAGLVAYKLCDRDGECEDCPFDRAMRGAVQPLLEATAKAAAPAAGWSFPGDRLYHRGHTWVERLANGRVRWGVDAFAARLVERPAAVILPAAGSHLYRGQVACWLEEDTELIPLSTPISGIVHLRNHRAQEAPGLVAASPYGEGWLLEMGVPRDGEAGEVAEAELLDAGEARSAAEEDWQSFLHAAAGQLERGRSAVGATLPDGGQRLFDLRRMLGPARYRELVCRYLR